MFTGQLFGNYNSYGKMLTYDYALTFFFNLGAKSQPNTFDDHRFETLCLQHTLARLLLILQNLGLSRL